MDFSTLLNRYIDEIGCSAKELAEASGISAAAISRYRAAERTPDPDSKQLSMLTCGIVKLSNGALDEQDVRERLTSAISGIAIDYETFLANLTALLKALDVNNNELARTLSFDPSYISRILAGQRRPADLQAFIAGASRFAARRSMQNGASKTLQELIGSQWNDADDEAARADAVSAWLGTNYTPLSNPLASFLEKIDAFNLDDFIRAIHFDEMKAPTSPIQLPTTKTYTGIHEMMECEIDFLKAAVLAKSSASVIMFSDMPLEEMAGDDEFPKKWMYGMAMLLKKGLHLNMIHDTNRPLPEMMLGLESWIPMYMTGQISPYYFDAPQGTVFNHILKVAGTVAMQGESIGGHQGEGRYVLTKSRDEVRYYRRRAERMLEKARPLMRIITSANADELSAFMRDEPQMEGPRRIIMSTLPLGAIPLDLLDRMLERTNMPAGEADAIRAHAGQRAEALEALLTRNDVRLELANVTPEEFEKHPPALDLSCMFRETAIPYAPDEYAEHLDALRDLVARHPSCTLVLDATQAFRNVQITVCTGHYALVSKNVGPSIHFIIEHPAMVSALASFETPVSE